MVDLGVSADRGVAGLVLVKISLLLLLRDELRSRLLNLNHAILSEWEICFIGLLLFIISESMMVSSYRVGSPIVLIQRLVA